MPQRTIRNCVKVFHRMNGYLAAKDHRNSWGMCTTSIECKTIMTSVLTVMSGMDPHTIRDNLDWFGWEVGSRLVLYFRPSYHSGLCGMFDVASRGE
jgi:hypothetical protein